MNADEPYSSISRAEKREKLMALIERRKNKERTPFKNRDYINCNNFVKENTKLTKENSYYYKKFIRKDRQKTKVLKDIKESKESCLGPKRKKQRIRYAKRSSGSFHQSCTENKSESASGELADFQFKASTETDDHILPYVNKLHDYRKRSHNTVIFDGQDRIIKLVFFVSSLLDNMKNPILIIACNNVHSLWENEFSKWSKSKSKSINVVTYKGSKGTRVDIRDTEFYSENGCLKFHVLLATPDAIFEDMEKLDHIKWELLVIDECQRAAFLPHFKKFRMLMADMKLLTVSAEPVDVCQNYGKILSLFDCKYQTNDDINKLKEKLSPFIAFECNLNTCDYQEYWVPVHLSCMQIEQYCSILSSNMKAISLSSNNSSLKDILTKIQKCCDHPYLVEPALRESSRKDSLIDPLDAEINLSGKMQLLDKLLLEIKRCGLRALLLFQSAVNSENISTGEFLDDLVHRRFGENSYVYIPKRNIHSDSEYAKKKELLKMFNNSKSDRFICLLDYRVCHSSITLSRVDVVILFNSVVNPLNDIKALKRITIDSPCDPLHVFRLYSTFTIEEKSLILAKHGTTVNYITSSVCHQLLAWGASYLFQKDKNSESLSFTDDLVHELSSIMSTTRVKTGPTNGSVISKAQMQNGAYSDSIMLFGESDTHTMESCIDEYLVDNTLFVFWNNLVKQSQHTPENLCSKLSGRVRKSSQVWLEYENLNDETASSFVKAKPRSKRKVNEKVKRKRAGTSRLNNVTEECNQRDLPTDAQLPILPSTSISDSTALNPRTYEGQQSQSDQPPKITSTTMPLETEIEKIQKEREQITKLHEEKISMLVSEREKEISEVNKKYDALFDDSETIYTKEIKNLEDYEKLVDLHKLLAEICAQNWHENLNQDLSKLNLKKKHKGSYIIIFQNNSAMKTGPLIIPNIPASALVRPKNPCLTNGPTTYLSARGLTASGLRAPPPHLRAKTKLFASIPNLPANGEPILDPFATQSTTPTLSWIQTESNCPIMEFDRICDEFGRLYHS